MTNPQVRLLASAIAMIAEALASSTDNLTSMLALPSSW